ncbi:hypothetical protein LOZ61_004154 [Ophidiomyces ophidiicola]|uniref:Uncharacterized protein n=1 Tax=Ophidiomyces ophidiicola TaxID=1387563 RepID=A0ACB8V176_9EURO|nr:uncharacterized protein LOZ57_005538 [Ophidiomyces ophidiicola]KAI1910953.1 hypothetical protein LOZ61_004154 [Ophidiomyces ophidiicola]KAI1924056.1 hypothetical protein LOZ64_000798 [Ophidiomyces ophidiicola]KAI1927792.1 hypothetical protein LOZ60_002757 [Ophidiomyces ophidiicola]KAI1941553.1 hypothetical protein LOZ57_005538 [Ophidiomyces ophidiicola]KAI1998939.1 hypothetical protein LOZ50_006717 [Ophidiomyces ophidiicola]
MAPRRQPRASFEPISPNLDLAALVESTPNFEYVVRIHCDAIDEQGIEDFEKLVQLHVIMGGKPLVVEGYQERLEKWTFSSQWLKDNHGKKTENARNITVKSNLPLTIGHYLKNMPLLTDQWTDTNYKDMDRQRIYLKDIDCPPVWHEKLGSLLPPFLFYLNHSTAGSNGSIARSGDLMSCLPPEMRAENLMCYIGHEGTYTPSHREMCATLGHNIMVETSSGLVEDGNITKPGSSIWFMTETKDRHLVSEYWLSRLGHDIEIEDHFAQINAWKLAPFKTYVVEQKVGDFILIPPLAPHQVWNRGTRTMKVAWNRTTVETLEMAINEALPKARMVCRDEQYKNKAIIYYTLMLYSDRLRGADPRGNPKVRQLQKDFRRLFSLYTEILLSETFSRDLPEPQNVECIEFSSNVICSYCRCNIFNRFLTCTSCIGKLTDGDDDNYDICLECYSIGRSCACISRLKWVEQFRWKDLTKQHEIWRNQILQFRSRTSTIGESLEPLSVETGRLEKKSLAEICQEELKRRPWNDITKPDIREEHNEVIEVNDDGQVRKRRRIRRSEKFRKQHGSCHICKTPEPKWKLATCSSCAVSYCYGSLYRAFDISPRETLEQLNWSCPKCRKICSCGACRRDPTMKPYEPTGTSLGHDTRKVADPRSVESLVDFSQSNINWIIKAGDHGEHLTETRRLKKRLEEAEKAKELDPVLDDHDIYHDEADGSAPPIGDTTGIDPLLMINNRNNPSETQDDGDIAIDPTLGTATVSSTKFVIPSNAVFREDMTNRYEVTEGITFEYSDPEASVSALQNMAGDALAHHNTHIVSVRQHQIGNSTSAFGLDGISENTTIIQSDLGGRSSRAAAVRNKLRSKEDEEFQPDAISIHNLRTERGRIVPKRKAPKVRYTEDPFVPSDQEEMGPRSQIEATRAKQIYEQQIVQDTGTPVTNNQSPHSTAVDVETRSIQSNPIYGEQAFELSESPSTASPSSESMIVVESKPMTENEKNRRAKIMAMQWAEGEAADIDSEAWA